MLAQAMRVLSTSYTLETLVSRIVLMGDFGHRQPQRESFEWHHDKLYCTTIFLEVTTEPIGIVIMK
jgi:hypothetical protein